MNQRTIHTAFVAALFVWALCALVAAISAWRVIALGALPVAWVMWHAANAYRVTQSTQLVLPVLLLPGALMCFVGMMQAFGYGRMADENLAINASRDTTLRAAFFIVGLALHFAAYLLLARENRASDHPTGDVAERV
jgi:hypothetical protein